FIDIAYNFLVDANGTIYKGRYSGPNGTCYQDTTTGENKNGRGVTGAHTGGWNSGTMGIAVLGNYEEVPLSEATRTALVEHLAWESERHLLDPLATSTFTNPAGGGSKTTPNISGHRDWSATACPGKNLYAVLPTIRQEVAARTGEIAALDTKAPRISRIRSADVQRRRARIRWRTSEPATGQMRYWVPGRKRRLTPPATSLRRPHEVVLRGLRRDSEYRFVVIGRDDAGNLAKSRVKRFETG
ncbi:MAG: N-acetylmuramoyl-L-alanine amidase, partial [Actinomycetota bacterium]